MYDKLYSVSLFGGIIMKLGYEAPALELLTLESEDCVTTSTLPPVSEDDGLKDNVINGGLWG